jgi:undecaprenyl-diphosphatase
MLVLAILFAKLTDEVHEQEVAQFDRPIALAIHSTTSPTQTGIMLVVTNFGQPYLIVLALLSLVIGGFVVWRNRHDHAFGLPVALMDAIAPSLAAAGAFGMDEVIKAIVGRQRPNIFPPLTMETGFSFPSGHTITSLTFYGMCAFLLARPLHGWARAGIVSLATIIVAAVAYSRVYLGVHYPTDVLGSLLLGCAWLLALIITLTLVERHLKALHQLQQATPSTAPQRQSE